MADHAWTHPRDMTLSSWLPTTNWKPLNRVGGVSALLFVLFGVAALTLYVVSPPPVSGGAATLRFIAENKASYVAQQLLWLVPSLFALIVFTALFVAVLPKSPVLTVLGFVIGGVGRWAGWIGIATGALGLLSESLRFIVPAMYAVYGPMLWLWFAIIGFVLFRLPER